MQILNKIFGQLTNYKTALFFLVIVAMVFPSATTSRFQGEAVVRENKVKAAFVYNFTQFVEWPANAFADQSSPFVIGIVGKESFANFLSQVTEGEQVNGHPIVIRTFENVAPEIEQCHILFLEKSLGSIRQVTENAKDNAILTISDHDDFMEMDGILRFFVDGGKVRFEINRKMAEKAGLVINPKLLKLATIYKK
jgi:hypothetical protein